MVKYETVEKLEVRACKRTQIALGRRLEED